ncbi:hypothetical protein SAMN04487948_12268 [Halogranum amylolyticum]|uniref:DUF8147 domain-containing protein n=1 Tax=Halogranum amylolyticum TaxID=660520 RepID=A0A1H8W3H1_9EURY|nr:hypothetical protein [Halogranum amylolyticum]SEP22017.1 hypothetical protein SAMN04487948_12268 [Halogranum amylolyticum]
MSAFGVVRGDRRRYRRTRASRQAALVGNAVITAGDVSSAMASRTRPPAVAALLGLATLFAVGFGVTALLDPYVWPSLLVGIPAGVVAGVLVTALTYWFLTRSQRSAAAQQDDR